MSLWLLVTGLMMVAAPLTFIYFKKIKEARTLQVRLASQWSILGFMAAVAVSNKAKGSVDLAVRCRT